MYGHVALHAFPVIFGDNVFQSQRELVLGQPVGDFDLRGHHGRLKRAKLLPHGPFGARPGLRPRLRHPIFDGHLPRHPRVELDGERGVAMGGLGGGGGQRAGLRRSQGGFRRQAVFSRDLKVAGLLTGGFGDVCAFFGV